MWTLTWFEHRQSTIYKSDAMHKINHLVHVYVKIWAKRDNNYFAKLHKDLQGRKSSTSVPYYVVWEKQKICITDVKMSTHPASKTACQGDRSS